ncbi:MAG: hypothetical protein QOJ29_3445 [Thermoleophilaceae bacterium]|jgi:hypothetical protein|nr:hypothetical protein [Thermoleophilaceae bacterium]
MAPEGDETPWTGKERRRNPDRRTVAIESAVEEIATRAATNAAQTIAAIHRKRLVRHSFLAGTFCALLIALPLTLLLNNQRVDDARRNSAFNCRQWHDGATALAKFIKSDAKLRTDQRRVGAKSRRIVAAFNKLLGKGELKRLTDENLGYERRALNYWKTVLVPRLNALAAVNCHARFG